MGSRGCSLVLVCLAVAAFVCTGSGVEAKLSKSWALKHTLEVRALEEQRRVRLKANANLNADVDADADADTDTDSITSAEVTSGISAKTVVPKWATLMSTGGGVYDTVYHGYAACAAAVAVRDHNAGAGDAHPSITGPYTDYGMIPGLNTKLDGDFAWRSLTAAATIPPRQYSEGKAEAALYSARPPVVTRDTYGRPTRFQSGLGNAGPVRGYQADGDCGRPTPTSGADAAEEAAPACDANLDADDVTEAKRVRARTAWYNEISREFVRVIGYAGDQAGHILAASELGGSDLCPNFVPLSPNCNVPGSRWRSAELRAKAMMKSHTAVSVDITFHYADANKPFRPSHGTYSITGTANANAETAAFSWVNTPSDMAAGDGKSASETASFLSEWIRAVTSKATAQHVVSQVPNSDRRSETADVPVLSRDKMKIAEGDGKTPAEWLAKLLENAQCKPDAADSTKRQKLSTYLKSGKRATLLGLKESSTQSDWLLATTKPGGFADQFADLERQKRVEFDKPI